MHNTYVIIVFLDAALDATISKEKNATRQDIVGHIQNWFRNSRDLEGGKTQRAKKKCPPTAAGDGQ